MNRRLFLLRAFPLVMLAGALPLDGRAAGSPPASTGLRVSDDGRHLVQKQDGQPFFLLADTVWNVTHVLNREDMIFYLDRRAAQGFNAIFFSGISERGGIEANAYGDTPYVNDDFLRPAITPGADPHDPGQYDFWDHLDFFIHECEKRGMYAAMNPVYASWYVRDGHVTLANAEELGVFWGRRYGRESNIIWVLGGDIAPDFAPQHLDIHRRMARGIAVGATDKEEYSTLLMTYHPPGQSKDLSARTSSKWYHDEPWLDVNMLQTGQADYSSYDLVRADYQRTPVKPVFDGEPWYEAHPHRIRPGNRMASAFDARKRAYWSVFAGAFGHTYGENSVMLLWRPGDEAFRGTEVIPWKQALDRPGGLQLKFLRRLIESRPMLDRVPDQSLLVWDTGMDFNDHIQGTRGKDYAMIYSTSGSRIDVRLGRISGKEVRAWWFDPRTGEAKDIGLHPNRGEARFQPPSLGLSEDWVLVLDDASKNYLPPGQSNQPASSIPQPDARAAGCAHGASPAADDPIRLHPENPRYFFWRDKTTILIGASEPYFAVANAEFDYKTYLDTIASDRSNVTRLMTGILVEASKGRTTMAVKEGQLLPPWKRSDTPGYAGGGNKFDLSQWEPAYFARLRDFVAEAGKRGIVVNLIIFSPLYNETHWSLSPFNPGNNVSGIDPRISTYDVSTLDRHGGLLGVQEALVRKIVAELRSCDNVIYELSYGRALNHMTMEWERHMLDVLDRAQKAVGDRKLMAVNLRRGTEADQGVDPRVSVVNHINASPAAVAAHATATRAVGMGEVHRELMSDPFARMRAWEFVLAGAGLYAHIDNSFGVSRPRGEGQAPPTALSGGGPTQRRHLRILTEFMSTTDYVHMRPAPELLAQPFPGGLQGRILARPSESYIVYVRIPSPDLQKARMTEPDGKTITFDKTMLLSLVPSPAERRLTVHLDVTPGRYRIEWITPATGEVARAQPVEHTGGTLALETPVFSEDIAVRLLRDRSVMTPR